MPVYLDHAATTPLRPEALAAFTDALGLVGNPSSIHSQGQQARRMLEEAREAEAPDQGRLVHDSQTDRSTTQGEGHPRGEEGLPGGAGQVAGHRVSLRYLMRWGSKGLRPRTSFRYCSYSV